MDDVITIAANLSTKGFEKGTRAMQRAINSLNSTARSLGSTLSRSSTAAVGSMKRLATTIIGVGSAYGIISRAVSAFMSQNEQLSAKMSSIWTALGNVLAPILTQIINWVTTAVSYFLEFLRLLGITGKSASDLSKKASGSAGQLQKTLAGFDELNVLNDSGGGGGGGATLDDVDPSEWMKKLADLLKNKMWDEAADMIIEKMNNIIYTIRDKAYEVGEKIGEYLQGIIHVIARVLDEVDWKQLGVGIANFINGLIKEVEGINLGEDLGKILVAKFTIGFKILTGFLETLDWSRVAEILSGIVTGAFDAITRAIEQADFKKIGANIRTFFENIDWGAIKESIFNFLHEAWNGAVDLLWGILAGESKEEPPLIKSLRDLGDSVKRVFEDIGPLLQAIWDKLQPILEYVITDGLPKFFENLADALEDFTSLLKGDMSLGEFVTDLNALEAALAGLAAIKVGSGLFDLAKHIKTIASVLGMGGTGAASAGASVATAAVESTAAVTGLVTGMEILGATAGAGAAGLAMYGVSLLDAKFSSDYAREAFESTGGTVEGIASKMNELALEASHLEDCLYDTTGWTAELGWSMQESRYAAEAYDEMLLILAESLGISSEELKAQIEAANGNVLEIEALSGITNEYTKALSDQERILENQKNAVEDVANAVSAEADAVAGGAESTRDAAQAAQEAQSASKDLSGETQNTGRQFGELEKVVIDSSKHMRSDFEQGLTEMGRVASSETQDMNNVFAMNLGIIASNAFYWGQDVIYSFNNGLINAVNSVLVPTMENIAMAIRNYIGFSEPKLGPLSDFHTFAPDMMQLFASGIDREKSTVLSSVAEVASGISDTFGNSDFSIGANMSALGAINANVPFQMPVVAGGGIMPYSVANGGFGGGQSSETDAVVLMAIERLSELVSDFHNDVQNMQWVLQFGRERAVVQEITKMQKQMERAAGK